LKLNLITASLLSFLFIIEAAAMSGIIAGVLGLIHIPLIDPKVAAIVVAGIGIILVFSIMYKSNP
jgi:hypothetical protein